MTTSHLLTLSCPDRQGIVYAVTETLAKYEQTIIDLQQFSDPSTQKFFMRVHFGHAASTEALDPAFEKLAATFSFDEGWGVRPAARKTRVLIMVSKIGHCLNDLLFRVRAGKLNVDVAAVVSNHDEFRALVEGYGIPFFHLPVTKDTKDAQESQVLELVERHNVDLVVLARYMQVLSPRFCAALPGGRIINIHHSFLPSFKGAKPYHQAFDRGVKIIGATAHFVTPDLDEGPIIEQRVARVSHAMDAKEMVEAGSDVETQVLAAAVKWYSEGRVFLNGIKTVVFD